MSHRGVGQCRGVFQHHSDWPIPWSSHVQWPPFPLYSSHQQAWPCRRSRHLPGHILVSNHNFLPFYFFYSTIHTISAFQTRHSQTVDLSISSSYLQAPAPFPPQRHVTYLYQADSIAYWLSSILSWQNLNPGLNQLSAFSTSIAKFCWEMHTVSLHGSQTLLATAL